MSTPPPPPPADALPAATPPPAASEATYPEPLVPEESLPLLAILPERAKQRRWTVLLRAILAIPLALAVLFVGIAALVCVVLGWFAALVMGRVPQFVRTIVTVYLLMMLRLEAYLFLLTDRFPPFSVDDVPEYHASLAVPPATRLNRAAVLFRLVLVIPASIAVRVVGLGLYVISFFIWVVVLITGWLPKPVHEVYQVFIRYELRVIGYLSLLVPTYPGEVFGDLAPQVPVLVPGEDAPTQDVNAPAPSPRAPQPWKLVLSMGAKRFLVVSIVLGIGAAIGLGVLSASVQNHRNLVQLNNQLVSSINQLQSTTDNCHSVLCLEQADAVLSAQLASFVSATGGADRAGVSQEVVTQVTTAAQHTERLTEALAQAGPSLSDYRSAITRLGAQQTLNALVRAQQQFADAVNASRLG